MSVGLRTTTDAILPTAALNYHATKQITKFLTYPWPFKPFLEVEFGMTTLGTGLNVSFP